MVGLPFKATHKGKDYIVNYQCGQPMGAYSSWAKMSLTHHFIVYVASQRAGLTSANGLYTLLGDDIVIANDSLASHYLAIMNQLGVEVSTQKTHVSSDSYEFAKRWIKSEVEISPFPISGLWSKQKRYNLIVQLIYSDASRKGFKIPDIYDCMYSFYKDVKHFREKSLRPISLRSLWVYHKKRFVRGTIGGTELVNQLM